MSVLARAVGAAGVSSSLPPLILAVAVLITAAKRMAALSSRPGQPAILAESLAGLLLGPTFLDFLSLL